MLQKATLRFLLDIKENNNKPWMDANRAAFIDAKNDFENLVSGLLSEFGNKEKDIAHLTAKECTFRQNRDIRFSKDKSPYKINMGAYINRGGKKTNTAGYYFHLEPGNKSFVGGGLWMPEAPALKKVRQEIDYCYNEFTKIISTKAFKENYGDLNTKEHSLSREPKGYEKDNPAIKYLKLKSFVALRPVSDNELTSPGLIKITLQAFTALQPLIHFLNRSIDE